MRLKGTGHRGRTAVDRKTTAPCQQGKLETGWTGAGPGIHISQPADRQSPTAENYGKRHQDLHCHLVRSVHQRTSAPVHQSPVHQRISASVLQGDYRARAGLSSVICRSYVGVPNRSSELRTTAPSCPHNRCVEHDAQIRRNP